jgi:hypothetical protein
MSRTSSKEVVIPTETKKLLKKATNDLNMAASDEATVFAKDDLLSSSKESKYLMQKFNDRPVEVVEAPKLQNLGCMDHLVVSKFGDLINQKAQKDGFFTRLGNTRAGKAISVVAPWVFSKGVIRVYNIIVPAVAFAGVGALAGVAPYALPLAVGAMLFNSVRDTRSLRHLKNIEKEHNTLKEYNLAHQAEMRMLQSLKDKTGIDLLETRKKEFEKLKQDHPGIHNPSYQNQYSNESKRSWWKTILGSSLESSANIATVAIVAVSGAANAALHAASVGSIAGIVGVADVLITHKNKKKIDILKNGMRKNIDVMREDVPYYRDIDELSQMSCAQRIYTEALHKVMKKDDLDKLSEQQIKDRLAIEITNLEHSPEFASPHRPTRWEKVKQYMKDFNSVHWPNNSYGSMKKVAVKIDQASKEMVSKYDKITDDAEYHLSHKRSKDDIMRGRRHQIHKKQNVEFSR